MGLTFPEQHQQRIYLVTTADSSGLPVPSSTRRWLLSPAQIQVLVEAQQNNDDDDFDDEVIGVAALTTVTTTAAAAAAAAAAHEEEEEQDDCCAVCMEDFCPHARQSPDTLSLPCGHLFHKDCKFLVVSFILYLLVWVPAMAVCSSHCLKFCLSLCRDCRCRPMAYGTTIQVSLV